MKRVLSIATVGGLALGTVLLSTAASSSAQGTVASDRPAGLLIYPKLVSDPSAVFGGLPTDTLVQLTNTANAAVTVHCFYVDNTSHCSNGVNPGLPAAAGACRSSDDCVTGGVCVPDCNVNPTGPDFPLTLTANQAVAWPVGPGATLEEGAGTVPPAPEDFFIGELKCFEATTNASGDPIPVNANDLKGEATIESATTGVPGSIDARAYNAIGVQANSTNGASQDTGTLCLGVTAGSTECPGPVQYASCPATLILDHLFEGPVDSATTNTDLTLVPCTEDLASPRNNAANVTAVQFLVFNEFEQRFSASRRFSCFIETPLSDIDQLVGNEKFSIFNINVQGTVTGQTRIRPVTTNETEVGHGMLGVAEEFRNLSGGGPQGSSAWNLNYVGTNAGRGDFIRIR